MSVLEIEQKLKKIQQKIEKSNIIPTCIYVAKKFGEDHSVSKGGDYSCSDLKFEDNGILIGLYTYAMGDNEITVFSNKKMVFKASERGIPLFKSHLHPKVTAEKKVYEVETYLPGDWEVKIEGLHEKSNKPFPEKDFEDIKSKFAL